MSFLKRLFGGGGGAPAPAPAADPVEHEGFTIRPTPYVDGGQHQLCGVIEKEIGGELKSHRFVRADRFPSREDAIDATLRKARQIIAERGDDLFS